MSLGEQTFGVVLGVALGLFFSIMNNILGIIREQQKHINEVNLEKRRLQQKNEIKEKQKTDEEKRYYVNEAREYSQRENKPNFVGIDLSYTKLSGLNLRGANFTAANLKKCEMRYACLAHAIFEGANLSESSLEGCDLQNANLRGANLTNVNLTDANLLNAIFEKAIIKNTNFTDCVINNFICKDKASANRFQRMEFVINIWKILNRKREK